jgi:hypothetical protein
MNPYNQIILGAFFNSMAPIFLIDELTITSIILFIAVLSLGESLNSPKMYEYIFFFSRKGREGMFLSLAALPTYITQALGGYLSGILL